MVREHCTAEVMRVGFKASFEPYAGRVRHLVVDLHVLRRPGRVGRRGGEGGGGKEAPAAQGGSPGEEARRQGRDGGEGEAATVPEAEVDWEGSRRSVGGGVGGGAAMGTCLGPDRTICMGRHASELTERRGGHPFVELLDHFLGRNVPAADDSEVGAALGRRFRERRVRVLERRGWKRRACTGRTLPRA